MTIDPRSARLPLIAALIAALGACQPGAPTPESQSQRVEAKARAPQDAAAHAEPWALPVDAGQQPDLVAAPDGTLLLSWIERDGEAQRLRFARWADGRWSAPLPIAAGEGIGNTADTPHVRQTPDGALWALWLRKIGEGHARDVMLARSTDAGRTWSTPVAVNTDGTNTEHGFAAAWAQGASSLGVAWLDGRAKSGADGHAMHDGHAMQDGDAPEAHATMLRSAVFDTALARHDESAIDATTCDCCQTDVAMVDGAARVVYRDRAPGEIRDIAIIAQTASGWSAPRPVHADGWRMPGCPVNGPAIAAAGRDVAVAWYTMRGEVPTVRFARSGDGGVSFGAPLDLASSGEVLGRVDAAMQGSDTWVTWLTEGTQGQVLHAARVGGAGAQRTVELARLAGRGRGTGWPRLVDAGDGLRAVWTDVVDGQPVLRGARIAVR